MSHGRTIRIGYVHEESQDKGPHKMLKVVADGKPMDAKVVDLNGFTGSPLKDSEVLILTADDDDGKAYAIPLGPPTANRVDGLKPGEADIRNHKRGQTIKLDDDGHMTITNQAGTITKHYADGTIGVKPGSGKNVYLGEVDSSGCAKVQTVSGPSRNVYAKI